MRNHGIVTDFEDLAHFLRLQSISESPVNYKCRVSVHMAGGGGTESDFYRKLGYNPTSLITKYGTTVPMRTTKATPRVDCY